MPTIAQINIAEPHIGALVSSALGSRSVAKERISVYRFLRQITKVDESRCVPFKDIFENPFLPLASKLFRLKNEFICSDRVRLVEKWGSYWSSVLGVSFRSEGVVPVDTWSSWGVIRSFMWLQYGEFDKNKVDLDLVVELLGLSKGKFCSEVLAMLRLTHRVLVSPRLLGLVEVLLKNNRLSFDVLLVILQGLVECLLEKALTAVARVTFSTSYAEERKNLFRFLVTKGVDTPSCEGYPNPDWKPEIAFWVKAITNFEGVLVATRRAPSLLSGFTVFVTVGLCGLFDSTLRPRKLRMQRLVQERGNLR
jgi:hypothetical protein